MLRKKNPNFSIFMNKSKENNAQEKSTKPNFSQYFLLLKNFYDLRVHQVIIIYFLENFMQCPLENKFLFINIFPPGKIPSRWKPNLSALQRCQHSHSEEIKMWNMELFWSPANPLSSIPHNYRAPRVFPTPNAHPASQHSLGFFIKHCQGLGKNGKRGANDWRQRDVADDGVESSQQGRPHGNQGFWMGFFGAELMERVQEHQQELEERGKLAKGLLFLLSPICGCLGS